MGSISGDGDRHGIAALRCEADLAVGRQAFLDEPAQSLADLRRVLAPDQTERQLGHRLGGKHRLGAGAGIAGIDAVDLGRGPAPQSAHGRDRPFRRPEPKGRHPSRYFFAGKLSDFHCRRVDAGTGSTPS